MRWQSSNEPSIASAWTLGLLDRRHLPALHVRHPSLGVEDVDVDLGLLAERLDRRRAGVARSRADDRRPRVAPLQHPVHRLAEPLHGEILERQRRSMEQFEREQVGLDLGERRGRRMTEAGIGVAVSASISAASKSSPMKGDITRAAASG